MAKGELHSVQGSGLEWNEELRRAYAQLEADPAKRRRPGNVRERRGKNVAENQFARRIIKEGWTITKRGWPDFLCERDGELLLVEVKPGRSSQLKKEQLRVARALKRYGVPVRRWSPDGGFEEIPDEDGE